MQSQKPQFNNLHKLLQNQESRMQLSIFTDITMAQINNWLNPDSREVPKADSLVAMAKYFDCTVDYLLDLIDRRE